MQRNAPGILAFFRHFNEAAGTSQHDLAIYDALDTNGWLAARALGNEVNFESAVMPCLDVVINLAPEPRRQAFRFALRAASADLGEELRIQR